MTIPRTPAGGTGDRESVSRAARQTHDTADAPPSEVPRQLRRRRAAASRCEPLPDGRRDPLDDQCDERVTDAVAASWRAAWCHIARAGLHPIIPERVMAAIRGRNEAP
jgi:hypothetical protein